jgi:hypothetical protein
MTVPPTTSRIVQPSIVVGLVSGIAVGLGKVCARSWIAADARAVVFVVTAALFVAALACRLGDGHGDIGRQTIAQKEVHVYLPTGTADVRLGASTRMRSKPHVHALPLRPKSNRRSIKCRTYNLLCTAS